MTKKMSPEQLAEVGINIEEEDHSTFSPDANREFVLKCTNCGCENAKEISLLEDVTADSINEAYQSYYYCPNCKTKVLKYMI